MRQVGLNVRQRLQELGPHMNDLRAGNYKVAVNSISDFMDEPDLHFLRFLSPEKSPGGFGRFRDPIVDDLYEKQSQAMDPAERRKLCHLFQKRVMDEMAYAFPVYGYADYTPLGEDERLESPAQPLRESGFGGCMAG